MDWFKRAQELIAERDALKARVEQLEEQLKAICELRNGLIDENYALKEFILSMASQIGIIVKKL